MATLATLVEVLKERNAANERAQIAEARARRLEHELADLRRQPVGISLGQAFGPSYSNPEKGAVRP